MPDDDVLARLTAAEDQATAATNALADRVNVFRVRLIVGGMPADDANRLAGFFAEELITNSLGTSSDDPDC